MTSENAVDLGPHSVEVTGNMGEWFVRLVRGGKSYILVFELESCARAYAEGQRAALVRHRRPPRTSGAVGD
ncbi:hypothetical protein FJ958_10430 [Mesorhizobium sp. B2-3-5]|nr:hypothetical protein FJ958_10430 [Mesorhizobium sp. B2-3-5]